MKSFKKIAIGTVAAMSIATFVATPASAATTTLTVNNSAVSTGTVATNPVVLPVPADNSVDATDALKISITGLETGTTVSATSSNAVIVPALATPTIAVTASAGSSSLSINTGTGTTADFYIFTKTTAVGSVAVVLGGNTTTYYVKGTAGPAYNFSVVAPDSVNILTVNKVTVKSTDAFGNPVITTVPTVTAINSTVGAVSVLETTTGTFAFDLSAPATVGQAAVSVNAVVATITGFGSAAGSYTKFFNVVNPADELAALKASLAAEKAAHEVTKAAAAKAAADAASAAASAKVISDLAISDLKKSFNALIKKWNAKNPKAKVATIK